MDYLTSEPTANKQQIFSAPNLVFLERLDGIPTDYFTYNVGFPSFLSSGLVWVSSPTLYNRKHNAIVQVTTSCFLLVYMPVCLQWCLALFTQPFLFYFYWHSITGLNFKAKQIIFLVTNFPWRHVRNTWRDPFQIREKCWFAAFPTGTTLPWRHALWPTVLDCSAAISFTSPFFLKEWHISIGVLNSKTNGF